MHNIVEGWNKNCTIKKQNSLEPYVDDYYWYMQLYITSISVVQFFFNNYSVFNNFRGRYNMLSLMIK